MKRNKTANAIMVAIIAVIVICGVLAAGHIKGWFDRTPEAAVLTDFKGIVNIERDGVAFNVQENTALRKGDRISCSPDATVKIVLGSGSDAAGTGSIVLGGGAELIVEDPSQKSFKGSLGRGEAFACAKDASAVISFDGKEISLKQASAAFSVRAGAQSMAVYSGEADGVKAGNAKEWIGTAETVHELDINSLNDFMIAQIRAAGEGSGLIFAKADVDALVERRQAEIEEARRRAEEEQRAAEEAARKAEEAAKKAEEERREAEEAARKAAEEKKAAEEAAVKAAKEKAEKEAAEKARAEAEKKAAEDKKAADEAARKAEEAAKKAEEERKAAEEAAARAKSEEEKKAAEEAAAKAEAERKAAEEAAKKAEEERKAAEEAAAKAEEERKAAEEEAARKAAEEAAARAEAEKKAAEEAAKKAEEEARKAEEERKAKEEEERRRAEEEAKKTYCYLSIRCDTILNNMDDLDPAKAPYVPANGWILGKKKIEFTDGESVFDVLKRACNTYGIQIEYRYTPMYESYYIEGLHHLYEFDCGPESGWMYKVNGWFPNYGCSSYKLKKDDDIVWCYTCKGLGADVGGSVY